MKILYLQHSYVSPEEGGATRAHEFARILAQKGHDVTLVSSSIHYHTGKRLTRGLFHREKRDGFNLIRFASLGLYTNPILYLLQHIWNSLLTILVGVKPGYDIIYASSPPLFIGLSAHILSILKKKPFVIELRDLWPDAFVEAGLLRNRHVISVLEYVERFIYSHASAIVSVSPRVKSHLVEEGIPAEKISVICHAANLDIIPKKRNKHNKFTVTYAGAIGVINGVDVLLDTAGLMKGENVRFVIYGDGREKKRLEETANEKELGNVIFPGQLNKIELLQYITDSDVCIETFQPGRIINSGISNKLVDYLSCGRPVIVPQGTMEADLVKDVKCGLSIEMGKPQLIAKAIIKLKEDKNRLDKMGDLARIWSRKNLDIREKAGKLEALLNELITPKS